MRLTKHTVVTKYRLQYMARILLLELCGLWPHVVLKSRSAPEIRSQSSNHAMYGHNVPPPGAYSVHQLRYSSRQCSRSCLPRWQSPPCRDMLSLYQSRLNWKRLNCSMRPDGKFQVSDHNLLLGELDRVSHTEQSGSLANSPEMLPFKPVASVVVVIVVTGSAETEGKSRAPITSETESLTSSRGRRIVAVRFAR